MTVYTISLDEAAARLYERVAASSGRAVERVLADALFRLAGELSCEALAKKKKEIRPKN